MKNPTGYLLKAFDNAYNESAREFDKQAEQKKVEYIKKNEEELNIAKEQKETKANFQNWKNKKIDEQLNLIEPVELVSLEIEFKKGLIENPLFSKMFETKGFENQVIQINWYKFLE